VVQTDETKNLSNQIHENNIKDMNNSDSSDFEDDFQIGEMGKSNSKTLKSEINPDHRKKTLSSLSNTQGSNCILNVEYLKEKPEQSEKSCKSL